MCACTHRGWKKALDLPEAVATGGLLAVQRGRSKLHPGPLEECHVLSHFLPFKFPCECACVLACMCVCTCMGISVHGGQGQLCGTVLFPPFCELWD